MPRTLAELKRRPDLGLLQAYNGWMYGGPASVQCWRSYDDLTAYSRSAALEHLPAWRAFNRAARSTDVVGIWQETYRVTSGQWETIYDPSLTARHAGRTAQQLTGQGATRAAANCELYSAA